MVPKIFWNSLLVAPVVLSAAMLASAANAADVKDAVNSTETSVAELTVPTSIASDADVAASPSPSAAMVAAPVQVAVAPTEMSAPDVAPTTSAVAPAAIEAPTQLAQVPAAPTAQPAPAEESSLQQIMQYSNEGSRTQSQVTSISQLSDVQPTDWAFQALQSLVERYGCIAGYPDGTFRGSRAMTRYEFAAGMNACLDRVNELIAAGLADAVTREDLATLQRLQEEFAAELATLRGRMDGLEARTAELEANQFSTTTRLVGRTVFSLADAFDDGGYLTGGTNTVFQSRVRLNFDTSFFGTDRLRARLQWGNIGNGSGSNNGFAGSDAAISPLFREQQQFNYAANTNGNVQLSRLEYRFPIAAATVYVEARGGEINDIIPTLSPFADREQGSISRFGAYSPIYDLVPGLAIGAGLNYNLGNNFEIGGGYLSGDGANPTDGNGLFNGDYVAFGQLTYGRASGPFSLALTYANSYRRVLNSSSALVNSAVINAYGVAGQFKISPQIAIGGWGSYYDADSVNSGGGDAKFWSYAGTVSIADFGIEGSLLGFVVGVPPRRTELLSSGTRVNGNFGSFSATGRPGNENASLHIEGFYRVPLTDNISITPGVIWLIDPGNDNGNSNAIIGAVRTSFSF
jgi:hypothetical protein